MENKNEKQLNSDEGFSSEQLGGIESEEIISQEALVQNEISAANSQSLSIAKMSSIQDLLQKSWEIFKFNFWKFIGLTLLPLFGIFVVVLFLMLFIKVFGMQLNDSVNTINSIVLILFLFLVFSILIIILSFVSYSAIMVLIRDSSKNLNIKELLRVGSSYFVNLFWVNLLSGLLIFIGMFFFFIPGVILAVFYSMAAWTLFYEGKKGFAALSRSIELVKGYWWPVFLRFLVVWGCFYLIVLIPPYFINIESLELLSTLLLCVLAPFFVIYSCFIYWDLVRIKGN